MVNISDETREALDGFKHLNAYNDAHPDALHREWMLKHQVRPPGHRGRLPGATVICARCRREGHMEKTCKYKVDILGNWI